MGYQLIVSLQGNIAGKSKLETGSGQLALDIQTNSQGAIDMRAMPFLQLAAMVRPVALAVMRMVAGVDHIHRIEHILNVEFQ